MAKHFARLNYKFKYEDRTITGVMRIDLGRFEGQYSLAQYELDSMVMTSMIPFMPKQTGTFINVTQGMSQSIAGSGKVVAAAPPMGRYLYEGKVMVDSVTGKGPAKIPIGPGEYILRYRKGSKLKPTDRWCIPNIQIQMLRNTGLTQPRSGMENRGSEKPNSWQEAVKWQTN